MYHTLIGVDEAGRGPLAGPVAVGVVAVPHGFDLLGEIPGIADSKELSEKKREAVYERTQHFVASGVVRYIVQFTSAQTIDEIGIVPSVIRAVHEGVRTLAPSSLGVRILLDGLLHAPEGYDQKTIIHGDGLEPIIGLASILAKVERDHLMMEAAKQYPGYGFEKHKGYGTATHLAAIRELGFSDIHRKSFYAPI